MCVLVGVEVQTDAGSVWRDGIIVFIKHQNRLIKMTHKPQNLLILSLLGFIAFCCIYRVCVCGFTDENDFQSGIYFVQLGFNV